MPSCEDDLFCGIPVVTFRVRLDHGHVLRAVEHCNLHGTWESFKNEIKVQ